MTVLSPITPQDAAARIKAGSVTLVDIREPDEHAREHIAGAVSVPLSALQKGHLGLAAHGDVIFHCKSGMRTNSNCARLASQVEGPAFILQGGLDAWKRAGLPVKTKPSAPLEIMRQVQITIGLIVLAGVALTATVHPGFIVLPALMGAGLTFAGLSGWCGMAKLIALAPWNRRPA